MKRGNDHPARQDVFDVVFRRREFDPGFSFHFGFELDHFMKDAAAVEVDKGRRVAVL